MAIDSLGARSRGHERHGVRFWKARGLTNVGKNFERRAACERMSQSGTKRLDSSALLQHEKSNDIALNYATTKPHTVVCRLYGAGHCLP
jgi:hypothetical protein